jgi:diketogulonate reductase-like aldo/keto reductase
LEAGYRHIDTAYNYLNEDAIGEVLQQWIQSRKVKREELFIVTKVLQLLFVIESSGERSSSNRTVFCAFSCQ